MARHRAEGWHITIFTARGMSSLGNAWLAEMRYRAETEKWLADHGVLYNELLFGKPPADKYVDDRSQSIERFVSDVPA